MDMSPTMFYLIFAVALIGAELIIMHFSVFWFLFFGVGALLASLVGWIFPELSWAWSTGVFLVGSLATAALLYPPLKRWQAKPGPIAGNDVIGQSVEVIEQIAQGKEGKVLWSGSDWPARLAEGNEPIDVGDHAVIKELQGIRLIVGK